MLGVEEMIEDLGDAPGPASVLHLLAHIPDQKAKSIEGRLAASNQVSGFVKSHNRILMEPTVRFELTTCHLRGGCSAS